MAASKLFGRPGKATEIAVGDSTVISFPFGNKQTYVPRELLQTAFEISIDALFYAVIFKI